MPREEFDAFVTEQIKCLQTVLESDNLMPQLAVRTKTMEMEEGLTLIVFADGFNDAASKRAALMHAGRQIYQQQVIPLAIALAAEAWMSSRTKEEQESGRAPEPRFAPNKREVILLGVQSWNEHRTIVVLPVKRDAENRIVVDGEPERKDNATLRLPLLDHFFRGYVEAALGPMPGVTDR